MRIKRREKVIISAPDGPTVEEVMRAAMNTPLPGSMVGRKPAKKARRKKK